MLAHLTGALPAEPWKASAAWDVQALGCDAHVGSGCPDCWACCLANCSSSEAARGGRRSFMPYSKRIASAKYVHHGWQDFIHKRANPATVVTFSWKPEAFSRADAAAFTTRFCNDPPSLLYVGKGLHDACRHDAPTVEGLSQHVATRFREFASLLTCLPPRTLIVLRTPYYVSSSGRGSSNRVCRYPHEEHARVSAVRDVLRSLVGSNAFGPRALLLDAYAYTRAADATGNALLRTLDGHHYPPAVRELEWVLLAKALKAASHVREQRAQLLPASTATAGYHGRRLNATTATAPDAACRSGRDPRSQSQWRKDVVLVVSVYDEWDDSASGKMMRRPEWTLPSCTASYAVAPLYQRRDAAAPRYVPNFGYEAGVYLRFVVDHYDDLPEVVAFVQAHAARDIPALSARLHALSNASTLLQRLGGYVPLNDLRVRRRTVAGLRDYRQRGIVADVERCWRAVAALFGSASVFGVEDDSSKKSPTVTFYAGSYFAVTRSNIQRHKRGVWAEAYSRMVVNGSCEGSSVHGATTTTTAGGPDPNRGKDTTASAFEHLAHVIWGRSGASYDGPRWASRSDARLMAGRGGAP